MKQITSIVSREYSHRVKLIINLMSSASSFIILLGINFFLSPYIVRTIGIEANGFIQLGINFTSYAALTTIALNSMAGRFVSIAVHKNDIDKANKYYTAVVYGNVVMGLVLAISSFFVVLYLEHLVIIPPQLVNDVRLLFALLFASFILGTAFSFQGISAFVRNRLYLDIATQTISQILQAIALIVMFSMFDPRVFYKGLAFTLAAVVLVILRFGFRRVLLPEVRAKISSFDWSALWELLSSGFWNMVSRGGHVLLLGLSLLIANLFVSPSAMGVLAIAMILPNTLMRLKWALASVFVPSITEHYAREDMDKLKRELISGMKIIGIILSVPLAGIFVFGYDFFSLWLPSEDAQLLYTVTIFACFGFVFTSTVDNVQSIFIVTNRLKTFSLLMTLSGFLSFVVIFVSLQVGVPERVALILLAGVPSLFIILRNLLYAVPFGAKHLGFKWHTFYPCIIYSVISVFAVAVIGLIINLFFTIETWTSLAVACVLTAAIGYTVAVLIVFSKDERRNLLGSLKKTFRR